MKDGVNSANRYYLNRFKDAYRQAVIGKECKSLSFFKISYSLCDCFIETNFINIVNMFSNILVLLF